MQNGLSDVPVNRATSSSDDSENKILLYEEFVLWNPKNGKFSAISLSDNDKCINKVDTQTAKLKITSRIFNAVPRIRVRKNLIKIFDNFEPAQTSEEEVKTLTNENIQDSVSVDNFEPEKTSQEEVKTFINENIHDSVIVDNSVPERTFQEVVKKFTNENIQDSVSVDNSESGQTSEEVKNLIDENIGVGVCGQTESKIVVKIEDTGELKAHCEKPVIENCTYKRFECYQCKINYKSHYHVQKHIYLNHNGIGFYECRLCKLTFNCSIRYGSISINLYKNLKHDPCDLCKSFLNFGCAK
ncbi:uncharacterized protein LOC106654579 [Trichogramma pretiosum]|uniref:uncharacterized protein LOC106654579 n=1 Tax=Trichogramma pretiosum TaxID=7493 RepID=UPI0006C96FCA|nr:uncharacterized protein LOC106654579 [Trichogramma pretiosum]